MDIPKPLSLDANKRLVLAQGGGCLSVFGLPFFGAGVFMLLAGLNIIPFQNADEIGNAEYIVIFLMGLAFAAVGASLVFGRKKTVFDRERGIVSEEWRLIVPVKKNEARLRDFGLLALRFDEGDSDSADRYPLFLVNKGGGKNFDVASPIDFGEARKMAVCLSHYLALPLEDRTTATKTVYEPAEATKHKPATAPAGSTKPGGAEQTPSSRLPSLPPRPDKLRSEITDANGELTIFMPQYSFVSIIIWIAIAGMTAAFFAPGLKNLKALDVKNPGDFIGLLFMGFFALVIFGPVLSGRLKRKNLGTTVSVTRGDITIKDGASRRTGKRSFPARDILAIDCKGFDKEEALKTYRLPPSSPSNPFDPSSNNSLSRKSMAFAEKVAAMSNQIVLKTKDDIVVFGQGLTREEAAYLCALIERRLRGAG